MEGGRTRGGRGGGREGERDNIIDKQRKLLTNNDRKINV